MLVKNSHLFPVDKFELVLTSELALFNGKSFLKIHPSSQDCTCTNIRKNQEVKSKSHEDSRYPDKGMSSDKASPRWEPLHSIVHWIRPCIDTLFLYK